MNIQIDSQESAEAERLYLSILIANTPILKQVASVLDPKLFTTPYSKRLCRWILGYYEANQKAPEKNINELFVEKKKEIRDPDELGHIKLVLLKMNESWDKYEHHDTQYTVKQIEKFLTEQKLNTLSEQIKLAITSGNIEGAEHLVGQYKPITTGMGNNFDLYKDTNKIIEAMKPDASKLFMVSGVLGEALGWFNKGETAVCLGPTKSGKSFLKLHIAMEALSQGLKVLYINGELSENMMIGRIWEYILGVPIALDKHQTSFPFTSLEKTASENNFNVVHKHITPKKVLRDMLPKDAVGSAEYMKHLQEVTIPQVQTIQTQAFGTISKNLRMHTTPRNNMKLADVELCLDNYRNFENFTPDVVVVDYADLLQTTMYKEDIAREDYVWRTLGGIAQERDLCLLTSTQGNRQAGDGSKYGAEKGVGGFYRKLSHVGKLFCISYTPDEQKDNLRRVFMSLERDGRCDNDEIVVATCFEISKFCVSSQYKYKVNYKGYS
jgi:hypothetical protein